MTGQEFVDSIVQAIPGDGTYAGARKLYLVRGLGMSLIERLRAVEGMAEAARLVQKASETQTAAKSS